MISRGLWRSEHMVHPECSKGDLALNGKNQPAPWCQAMCGLCPENGKLSSPWLLILIQCWEKWGNLGLWLNCLPWVCVLLDSCSEKQAATASLSQSVRRPTVEEEDGYSERLYTGWKLKMFFHNSIKTAKITSTISSAQMGGFGVTVNVWLAWLYHHKDKNVFSI